jgi:hypothetical protein
MFEDIGSTPGIHWSDRFLDHWAKMLDKLADSLSGYTSNNVVPRHAWEIVRLAGLPLPAQPEGQNPFLEAPRRPLDKQADQVVELWPDIVRSFILRDGGVAELLSALDRTVAGALIPCSWRGLDWATARNLPIETPAPLVGAMILGASPSPSLVCEDIPNPSIATPPCWWGVSADTLSAARRKLREQTPLAPDLSQAVLLKPLATDCFVLNTRMGTVSHAHTAAKWRARIAMPPVSLRFKEDWKKLYVSSVEPASPENGDAWINPDTVSIKIKGAKEKNTSVQATTGDQLLLSLSLLVEYSGKLDRQTGIVTGNWNPERSLVVGLDVRLHFEGEWDQPREIETEIPVVLPSPFSPTVLVAETGKVPATGPDNQDKFSADPASQVTWLPETTPTLMLAEENRYEVCAYDGTLAHDSAAFRPVTELWIGGSQLPAQASGLFAQSNHDLDDGVVVSDHRTGNDVLVFRVRERSSNLSSGLLSAVRRKPAGRRPPATATRQSVLGQYQDSITQAISGSIPAQLASLFQHVIAATDEPINWRPHTGVLSPNYLCNLPAGFVLPGIGNGPSAALAASPEWTAFMIATTEVCTALGLGPTRTDTWLSGLDVGTLTGELVRRFITAHAALISVAATPADRFWASFPFSIIMIEGANGANFGQLRGVLLSPLHPARLGWSFAVTRIARESNADAALLGLIEGWNIPCAGYGLNPAGQPWPLIAVPLDPGPEQDFVAWSALAVLGPSGIAELPLLGGGQSLPWGGRTGINSRVVERALRDYLVVHPHINAIEVDVRSIGQAPRSREIDDALLRFVGAAELPGIAGLGGGAKIWDSADRQGSPPSRDMLFAARRSMDTGKTFEWNCYPSTTPPQDADLAIIENATVHLAIVPGSAHGVIGLLPLRRFSPSTLQGTQFDQAFVPRENEDLLGLSRLLVQLEGNASNFAQPLVLRATPQRHALGLGLGAYWEVLGTFNIDPSLLSKLIASGAPSEQQRLLWEWRPSWMPTERTDGDLARRPYYIVARIPVSLERALHARQAITAAQANQLLRGLGQRGIGLSVLSAHGGTQESAAAGHFYAVQLLAPEGGTNPFSRLPPTQQPTAYGIIPLDPVEAILQGLIGRRLKERADLLAVATSWDRDGRLRICIVPAEIKHYGMPAQPKDLPSPSDQELKHPRKQLEATVKVLEEIIEGLASSTSGATCAANCVKRLALATLIDLAMSFSPVLPPANERSRILAAILCEQFTIGVGDPLLLWFAPGSMQLSGSPYVINPHQAFEIGNLRVREIYVDPSSVPGLWWHGVVSGDTDNNARSAIDNEIVEAFARCLDNHKAIACDPASVARLLGIPSSSIESAAPIVPPATPGGPNISLPLTQQQAVPAEPRPSTGQPPITNDMPPVEPPKPDPILTAPEETPTAAETPEETMQVETIAPRAGVGWNELGRRYAILGRLATGNEPVGIDLDNPKTVGIFGYMGSGKSYLLGTLIESALVQIPGVNALAAPLAVVIFNYRRNASDRFELNSLALPNDDVADVERLEEEYGARPAGISGVHVLCLPGELREQRVQEYGALTASELFFNPATLDVEDWELLMGEPGSDAVFARTIRNTLAELRQSGQISLDNLEQQVTTRLTGQSRSAARLRLDFVRRYLSAERGIDFADFVKPGRALVVDLRQPLFNKDDALRFFLVCANHVSRVQARFNKLIVFDEAHEYLSEAFGERMESRIRLMRHEGTSYIFATQDVRSIPNGVSRFLTTRFVFNLGTRENVQDLVQVAPEFRDNRLLDLKPGQCLVQANSSINGLFQRPREIRIRPRITKHGGGSQIFSGDE